MILLIFAIVMSVIFLTVEIPVYVMQRDAEDMLIVFLSGMMLAGCLVVLYYWR